MTHHEIQWHCERKARFSYSFRLTATNLRGTILIHLALSAEFWRILRAESASKRRGKRHGSTRLSCPHPARPSHQTAQRPRANRRGISRRARRGDVRPPDSRETSDHILRWPCRSVRLEFAGAARFRIAIVSPHICSVLFVWH